MRVVWILLYVTALHLSWGVLLMWSDDPTRTVPLSHLVMLTGGRTASAVWLIAASVCSIVAMLDDVHDWRWGAALLMPQQILLTISAASVVVSAVQQVSPVGVPVTPPQALAGQASLLLLSFFHMAAIIWTFGGEDWSRARWRFLRSHSQP